MLYGDDLGNIYVVIFTKSAAPAPIQLTAVGYLANGTFALVVNAESNHSYLIQVSSDLVNWSDLTTLNISGATASFVDANAANSKYRFYRAKLLN